MNILIILAHPNKKSLNHAIADACLHELKSIGHDAIFHDLYEERFDPILPFDEFPKSAAVPTEIKRHCEDLSRADGIVIIHPNWWGMPPAVLSGWVDRVMRPGVAYEFIPGDKGEGVPRGLLKAKYALIFNTGNTETKRETGVFGDPLEKIWKNCVFDLCGVKVIERRLFSVVVTSTDQERKKWLSEVAAVVKDVFSETIEARA
jgi:NAD(P)H dehydrogenase (quinone)